MNTTDNSTLQAKDFASDQEVRWCPGCGDYAILSAVKNTLAKTGKKKEEVVFVSGIGCSSRFPYYLNTYGMHSIHGRATAIATGLKLNNPELSVWVATGDGDCLAIGGNHFIHAIRRNIKLNILIFNNEIYGLTKGQYSPTSQLGKKTKTSPYGTIETPFSPAKLALGAGATFFARSSASDPKHLEKMLQCADAHEGTSVVEIFQNCVIFNHDTYDNFFAKDQREEKTVKIEHGEKVVFGKEALSSFAAKGGKLSTVDYDNLSSQTAFVHDQTNLANAFMLAGVDDIKVLGILFKQEEEEYTEKYHEIGQENVKNESSTVDALIFDTHTWEITESDN